MFVGTHETDKSLNSTLRLVNTTFDTNTAEATGGGDASVMATVVSVRNLANVSSYLLSLPPISQSAKAEEYHCCGSCSLGMWPSTNAEAAWWPRCPAACQGAVPLLVLSTS